jgi:hypothetical protein
MPIFEIPFYFSLFFRCLPIDHFSFTDQQCLIQQHMSSSSITKIACLYMANGGHTYHSIYYKCTVNKSNSCDI